MAQKTILISNIVPGSYSTGKIYLPNNAFFLLPNQPIGEQELSMVKNWGFTEILTDGDIVSPQGAEPPATEDTPVIPREHGNSKSDKLLSEIDDLESGGSVQSAGQETTPGLKSQLEGFKGLHNECVNKLKEMFENGSSGMPPDKNVVADMSRALYDSLSGPVNIPLVLTNIIAHDKHYLYIYSVNVALLSMLTGMELKLPYDDLIALCTGALLHDIGMMKIPQHILLKNTALSEEDFALIKKHPVNGAELLKKNPDYEENIIRTVLEHHEQQNGLGYPNQLQSVEITIPAKIVGVVDMYEAMTHKRIWRPESPSYDVMQTLLRDSGKRFDPDVVSAFLDRLSIYPVGTLVSLNTGEVAIVTAANPRKRIRPVIRIMFDENGALLEPPRDVNLAEEKTMFIRGTVDKNKFSAGDLDKIAETVPDLKF